MACGACVNICPRNAIQISIDNEGYYIPLIDEKKCVECGMCKKTCPEISQSENTNYSEPKSFAVWAQDEIRMNSSSGGAFSVLAERIISKGGVVYGCSWTEELIVAHVRVDDKRNLGKLRKSKYIQSNTGNSFINVKNDLEKSIPVLYSGTPCQIAGLNKYLNRKYDNLYTVDIICTGIVPVGIWKKRLQEMSHDYGEIDRVDFRSKRFGWHCGSVVYGLKSGEEIECEKDEYMAAFLEGMFFRDVCSDCNYAGFPRYADITIGDFWNISRKNKALNDSKGTSLLITNSKKGWNLFDETKKEFKKVEEIDFEFTRSSNMFFKNRRVHPGKERFFNKIKEGRTFMDSYTRTVNHKYDIGLVGAYTAPNYGAHLTQYALYTHLSKMGYDVLMIDANDEPRLFKNNPYPKDAICKKYYSYESMQELNDMCDTFVVGSDQLWVWRLFKNSVYIYSLLFANSQRRKIAYSTSFGKRGVNFTAENKRYLKYALSRFQKISVREDSGVDICKENFGVDATQVMDPVFLPEKDVYDKLADQSDYELPEQYIFCYIIWPNDKMFNIMKRISEETGWEIVCVGDAGRYSRFDWKIKNIEDAKVEDWLRIIRGSKMIISDSFHAYCFSVIFEKQILSISTMSERLERMMNVADRLGMEKPVLLSEIVHFKTEEILKYIKRDYNIINKKLDMEVKRSIEWLNEALTSNVVSSSADVLFDTFAAEYIDQKIFVKKLKRKEMKMLLSGPVVAFGTGAFLSYTYPELSEYVDIDYLSDNNENRWGSAMFGKKCLSPEEVASLENPNIVVTIDNEKAVKSVKNQMNALGVEKVYDIESFWNLIRR